MVGIRKIMKKGVKLLLILAMAILPAVLLVGCNKKSNNNNSTPPVTPPPDDSKITVVVSFRDKTVTYQEGKVYKMSVDEQLPNGVMVSYYLGEALFDGATNVGTYNITARFTVTNAYNPIEDKHATLTITKKTLEVTPFPYNGELMEGSELPVIKCDQASYGIIELDQNQVLLGGTHNYTWTFTPFDTNNYEIVKGTISLTVTPRPVIPDNPLEQVQLNDRTFVYDGQPKSLELENVPEGASVFYSDNNNLTNVGFADVIARVEYNGQERWLRARLQITKNTLTITAEDKTQIYGDNAKDLTYQLDKPDLAALDQTLDITITRAQGNNVGSYNITINATSQNFDITIVAATYEITQRDLTITIDDLTATFGDAIGEYSYTVNEGTVIDGDNLQLRYTRELGTDVGDYEIDATATNTNYNITINKGTLHITPRPLTLQINQSASVYGDEIVFDYEPLQNLAYQDSAQTIGLTLSIQEFGVGEHLITASITSNNYTFSYNEDAQHIITQRSITIKIRDYESTYGDEIETDLKYDIIDGNIVNDDNLHITLTKSEGDTVGTYAITFEYDNDNYLVTADPESGTYTIIKKIIDTDNLFDTTTFTYDYDGDAHFIELENISGLNFNSDNNVGYRDVGEYKVDFTISPTDPYNYGVSNDSVQFTIIINTRNIDTSTYVFGPFTYVYTGSSFANDIMIGGQEINNAIRATYSGDIDKVDVGEYTVHCHLEPINSNYTITKSDFDAQLNIVPAENWMVPPSISLDYVDGQIVVSPENPLYEYSFGNDNWQDSNKYTISAVGDQILTITVYVRYKATQNYLASATTSAYITIDKDGVFTLKENPDVPQAQDIKLSFRDGMLVIDMMEGCEYAITITEQGITEAIYYTSNEFEIDFVKQDPDNPQATMPVDQLTITISVRYSATNRYYPSQACQITITLKSDGTIIRN